MEIVGQQLGNEYKHERLAYFSPFAFLILSILLYAFWGSPTPDALGLPEIIIATCLGIAVFPALKSLIVTCDKRAIYCASALVLPLCIGVLNSHNPVIVARDCIACIFILLPVLCAPLINSKKRKTLFLFVICTLGIVFSIRGIMVSIGLSHNILTYFANAPTVIFTCIYCIGLAFQKLKSSRYSATVLLFLCALLPFIAIQFTLQRASLGLIIISSFIFWLALAKTNYIKAFLIAIGVAATAFIFAQDIDFFAQAYAYKTHVHGANMRLAEWQAVFDTLGHSPFAILFGHGWGATVSSPAVADITVSYTHGFLSYMLLKTGFTGLGATLIYLSLFCIRIIRMESLHLKLALGAALAIPVLLYASYKSFDFGLILTLILVSKSTALIENTASSR